MKRYFKKGMKNYLEFKITTKPFLPDILSGIMWELEILGVLERENFLAVYAEEKSNLKVKDFESLLSRLIKENLIESFDVLISNIAEKNWNEEWEKTLDVIKVSPKIIIKPSFKSYKKERDEIVIEIDPKMSFGTGDHETTRLVLRLLEKHLKKQDKVLDVGSGTAILSIGSVMLGAQSAVAIDNNEWCYLNGIENVEKNKVKSEVEVRTGEAQDVEERDFDLTLANINKNVLREIRDDLVERTKKDGKIILSGVLTSDRAEIVEQYESANLKTIDSLVEGEWTAIVFKKD